MERESKLLIYIREFIWLLRKHPRALRKFATACIAIPIAILSAAAVGDNGITAGEWITILSSVGVSLGVYHADNERLYPDE